MPGEESGEREGLMSTRTAPILAVGATNPATENETPISDGKNTNAPSGLPFTGRAATSAKPALVRVRRRLPAVGRANNERPDPESIYPPPRALPQDQGPMLTLLRRN